jgi:D-alanyl-D-alanine-carboxypeptidase/D-alanyl-D-alanine-endopeptidase
MEKYMKILFSAIWLACCVARPACAGDIDPALARMASERVASGATPSLVVATIVGKERHITGFGVVGPAARQPDAQTVYEIGSISKTFTALLLADAVARAETRLEQDVGALLPGYALPHFKGTPMSLLDLATHTSALPRLPDNLLPRQPGNPYADYSEAELKAFLKGYSLPRAPGVRYEYSNLGYGLLGQALSARAGKPYAELVAERISTPLGLHDTGVALTARMQAQLAPGHDSQGRPVANWDMPVLAGAGALRSTAQDMLDYLQAHMRTPGTGAPPGLREVQLPRRASAMPGIVIGLAWHHQTVRGQPVVWHNGMTGGYASFIGFTADGARGVVVLGNASVSVDDIGMQALVPEAGASMAPARRLPAAALADYVGRYQLAPGFVLTVSAGAEGLLAQATGQSPAPVFAGKTDEFFFKVVEASLTFARDASGKVNAVTLHQGGRAMPAPRIADDAAAPAPRAEIALPPEMLRQYPGSYTLAPGFKLFVTLENGKLYAQASGQGRNELFASAPDEFFLKVVDAQLRFRRASDGGVTSLVLYQNGAEMPAPRNAD